MSKRTFHVTENMRRATSYEVDEADLPPELADLMERLDADGDLTEEDDRLVESLIAEADPTGDGGEVLDIYLADEAEYLLSIVTEGD